MARADEIAIRWFYSADAVPQSLWKRCFPPPLEGLWWYRALDRSELEDQITFAYAVLEQAGSPIGIAPTFVMNVPIDLVAPPLVAKALVRAGAIIPQLRYQRTMFVGSPCADEGTVGLLPGVSLSDAAPYIQDAVTLRAREVKASMIVWKDFPDEASPALDLLSRTHGLFRLTSYPGARLTLSGSFESYLSSLRSNKRYKLRKKLSLSRKMGPLEAAVVQFPDEGLLSEIFALFRQTYQRGRTKFERLTPEFFSLIAAEPASHFILLRDPDRGKYVAFMLCFCTGKRVINKFIGLDYAYRGDWFLYFRLWEEAVSWAARTGAEELQSGQTGYGAKLELGNSLVPLNNYCLHTNPLLHRIFKAVAAHITWATLDDDLKKHIQAGDSGHLPSPS